MNWDAAGAIGEIVGPIAVVITLLYLAKQTRSNARARCHFQPEFAYRLSEWHREIARDRELKRIMERSFSPEPGQYSDSEWFEFRFLAISLFRIYETGFIHMDLSVGNREESENHVASARSVIDTFPAWRRFWENEASTGSFTSGFIEAVNASAGSGDFRMLVAGIDEPRQQSGGDA